MEQKLFGYVCTVRFISKIAPACDNSNKQQLDINMAVKSKSQTSNHISSSTGHYGGPDNNAKLGMRHEEPKDKDRNRYKYKIEIQQMMFVSGEYNEPPESTTSLIEEIVRDQVVELVLQSQKTSSARGQRSISPEDVIFLIRHDTAKVTRLRTYLSWKDVRKNARDQESGDLAAGNDLMDESVAGGGGTNSGGLSSKVLSKQKKSQIRLPWELEFMFSEQPLSGNDDGSSNAIAEEEREAALTQLKRLKQNDERTKHMTKKEYVHYSDCRQASFTFRKAKRFREWCGLSQITESRPNDDVIDILGFLTFEMVSSITEEALKLKKLRSETQSKEGGESKKRRYLFDEPSNDSKPITVEHVQEAWRNLQHVSKSKKCLFNFRSGRLKGRPNII